MLSQDQILIRIQNLMKHYGALKSECNVKEIKCHEARSYDSVCRLQGASSLIEIILDDLKNLGFDIKSGDHGPNLTSISLRETIDKVCYGGYRD